MSGAMMLAAGFDEPVFDSARVFRTIMDVMARPGRVSKIPCVPEAPDRLAGGAAAVALTLLDADTPVWIEGGLQDQAVSRFLAFHTGAPAVERPEASAFAFMRASGCEETLRALGIGTADYPDRSGTAVITVDGFEGGQVVQLSGPGIDGATELSLAGLDAAAVQALMDNARRFPLGFDTIFVSADEVAALPRSTHIRRKD